MKQLTDAGSSVRPVAYRLLDDTFLAIFRAIAWLARSREEHRRTLKVVGGLLSLGIAYIVWTYGVSPWAVARFGLSDKQEALAYRTALTVIGQLLTATVTYLAFWAVVPLALVAQRAVAFNALGLSWVSTAPGEIHRLLQWYLRDHPETETIRIVCISGGSLFGATEGAAKGQLRHWAKRGKLDVIMPVSLDSNPTVQERFRTYEGATLNRYPTVGELVTEMKQSKSFLLSNKNRVTEHNSLCTWRIVILQSVCLVQSYFPNLDGFEIDSAPTFVFSNSGRESYYQTYLQMFELLKSHAAAIRMQPGSHQNDSVGDQQ